MSDRPKATKSAGSGPTTALDDKAPERLEKYEYQDLPAGSSIRMLTLYPGERDDPLRGKLELVDICRSGSYEPVSYVWGPSNSGHQISISDDQNDGIVQLTASLYGALKRFRYTDRERRLWADQICINQV